MRVWVLGTSRVAAPQDGEPVPAGARRPRAVLAGLALHVGSAVHPDTLVDLVWGEHAPLGAHGTLHTYVSGLRRALEPGLAPRERPRALVTTDHGYELRIPAADVDAAWFSDEVRLAHRELEPLATQLAGAGAGRSRWPSRDAVAGLLDRVDAALGCWAGPPYADLGDHPAVVAARSALTELRLTAQESRLLALLALGEHATVVAAAEPALAAHPLRERLWALQVLALYRSGRQGDALAALRRVRTLLAEELGADPGAELVRLEAAVLAQDPQLLPSAADDLTATSHRQTATSTPPREAERSGATPAPGTSGRPGPTPSLSAWPTVGRHAERDQMHEALRRAAHGRTTVVQLVGEPGIGKTRLVDELAAEALQDGFALSVGRCSQDEGAPPLWPWRTVIAALPSAKRPADDLMVAGGSADAGSPEVAFQIWERLTTTVREATASDPLLLVFEDLHWADTASVRALRHLVDTVTDRPLLLVLTRRPLPEPTGALAELVETAARRDGVRVDLTGLSVADAARLVADASGASVPMPTVAGWVDQSDGNPYFLIELARSPGSSLPSPLRDVVLGRVRGLPPDTRDVLSTAAVLGRRFSVDLLAAVCDRDPEEVEDALEPARTVGLLRAEDSRDGSLIAFSHALARDAVQGAIPPGRVARTHARVAHLLTTDAAVQRLVRPERRVAELARHWLAAGPTHTDKAWPAAAAAAAQARGLCAYEEANALMTDAVEAHQRDPDAREIDRYQLQLDRIADALRAAHWPITVEAAFDAIAVARRLDRPELVAAPAAALTAHSVWTPHDWLEVHVDPIDDLRWAMARIGDADAHLRCRLMLALAVELYYDTSAVAEKEALVAEGVAAARRLGDPALLAWALHAGWIASWDLDHVALRATLSDDGVTAAESAGDPDVLAVLLITRAADVLECGDFEGWRRLGIAAEELAQRRRLPYVLFALTWMRVAVAAMADDPGTLETQAVELATQASQVVLPAGRLHAYAVVMLRGAWEPELLQPIADQLSDAGDEWDVAWYGVVIVLARTGRLDALRSYLRRHPIRREPRTWTTLLSLCALAEAASVLGDPALAEQAAAGLRPHRGLVVLVGISAVMGPSDGYLALAEATMGDRASAAALADEAERLAARGPLPRYIRWLRAHRERLGF